jgi:CDP-glucose 4,6-dehydratase
MEELGLSMRINPSVNFWHGKRVLLTGHTGFKGAWLALWLAHLGAKVTGLSLPPATTPNLFEAAGIHAVLEHTLCDIRHAQDVANIIQRCKPEVVLHLAAQALVRASYREPINTFATNVLGTANVLDALRGENSVRCVVVVTTDKVYANVDSAYPLRETDALGGHDPYSASKAAAELVVASYRASYLAERGVAVASARAGNVIGGGDWSADRLIPDAVRAWQSGKPLDIRRPESVRPWQHVLEPLAGYLRLAEQLHGDPKLAGAYNFGPHTHEAATVRQVIALAKGAHGAGDVLWGDGSEGPHESHWLALETARSHAVLGHAPRWDLRHSVQRTMHWYKNVANGRNPRAACEADLADFLHSAEDKAACGG